MLKRYFFYLLPAILLSLLSNPIINANGPKANEEVNTIELEYDDVFAQELNKVRDSNQKYVYVTEGVKKSFLALPELIKKIIGQNQNFTKMFI